jgi:hypothetical protein
MHESVQACEQGVQKLAAKFARFEAAQVASMVEVVALHADVMVCE